MLAFIYFECFILDSFNVLIPSVFCMHKIHTCSYHQPVQTYITLNCMCCMYSQFVKMLQLHVSLLSILHALYYHTIHYMTCICKLKLILSVIIFILASYSVSLQCI